MAATVVESWYWLAVLVFVGFLVARWSRAKTDIHRSELEPNLDWGAAPNEALSKIYDHVVALSDSTIEWYRTRRRPKRYAGVSLRVGALLATAAAGFAPLAKQLIGVDIEGAWSTVLVASAGILVSIDGLGGYTSGWVRYMLAQQKVERLRDGFVLEWNALKLAKVDAPGMLERARTFVVAVGKVTDDETQEWATEFQNALKEMERARKTEAEAERVGAIEVSVKNPHSVQGWVLEIDGNERGRTSGKSIAVTDVGLGIRKLKAHGKDAQGKTLSDEKTIKVEGGTAVARELELS